MGEDYPIKSDADADYLHELAHFVEEKIAGVSAKSKLPARLKCEILAALLIADDYFSERKKNAEMRKRVEALDSIVRNAFKDELHSGV